MPVRRFRRVRIHLIRSLVTSTCVTTDSSRSGTGSEKRQPHDETIVLLDPDFVYLRSIETGVQPGHPCAQMTGYIDPLYYPTLIERHCRRPDAIQPIGWPVIIHRTDLAALTPLWIAKTEAIRNDEVVRADAGWITDMWGYVFAAAELGISHELDYLAATQMDQRDDTPFIHYCYESESPSGTWRWEKRWYEPAGRIPEPPDDVPLASRALIEIVNEWLDSRASPEADEALDLRQVRTVPVPA